MGESCGQQIENDLEIACRILSQGGVILYPTDTIWGLGCDATNPEAVKRIYEIKKREDSKSMLVLINSVESLSNYIPELPEKAIELFENTEKPLTIIYPGCNGLAKNLIAPDGSIGVRITHELFSGELCKKFGKPVVSTSANMSGKVSPANFSEIEEEIKEQSDYVVVYRQNDYRKSRPSSIIKLGKDGTIQVIR